LWPIISRVPGIIAQSSKLQMRGFSDNFEFIALPAVSLFDCGYWRTLPPPEIVVSGQGLTQMNGVAMRISTARVERCEALPSGKDRLTVVVIGTCLILALMSFGIVAIS
jgi:hypothetical protein